MKRLAFLLLAAWCAPAWATTYYFVGGVYNVRTLHTTCSAGTCSDFPAGARVTGSFTTAAPLAANQAQSNVAALVTSFSFSDGVNTYANGDANTRVFTFRVATNATGVPIDPDIYLQRWQAAAPHDAGNDRFDFVRIFALSAGIDNIACASFGASPDTGVADSCLTPASASSDLSNGLSEFPSTWSVDVPIVVPPLVATTYYVASGVYSLRIPHTTCSVGSCADFPLGTRLAGSFTTAVPIPPNLPDNEVAGLVSSYIFDDGVTTYASGDANARLRTLRVTTDASAVPTAIGMQMQRWQSAAPHIVGSRIDVAAMIANQALVIRNGTCQDLLDTTDQCEDVERTTDSGSAGTSLPTRVSVGTPLTLALVPATYSFTSGNFTGIINHTTCGAGTCADYAPSMRVSGTFTTVDTIPPGIGVEFMSGLIASYSFSDGLQTYASSDPLSRIVFAGMQTDPTGVPESISLILERWQAPGPHPAGSRFGVVEMNFDSAAALFNLTCSTDAGQSPITGAIDVCNDLAESTDTSTASTQSGQWRLVGAGGGASTPVPIGAPWMLVLLALVLGGFASSTLRARARR